MQITLAHDDNSEIVDTLIAGVREFNTAHMGPETSQPLSVVAHDASGQLIAGVAGRTIYDNFLINVLWVDEQQRGSGIGKQLMQCAETEAKNRGCTMAQVDTLSFQAPQFYQKLGFEIIGTVPGTDKSPERYFLLKKY
ncbi:MULTISPECIES: GNAT family N-acetyltransferase [Shewanella]|uniref:GNAT family N-acetyltransferase n=1 Tax=Shewanella fidelis TaxID=173509 RepID=A0AAW8NQT7_9GAMM|nr:MULTISPECIES: GNAT family N-acetyltransferase [Shewanella]MDR8525121.1 GNAT family N-acetyltransferase [Shewanella fidelis]MDW4811192.1 GNAT family N-acetyltransferase [Shewanella fidelis]MDW4815029.1 GNAT family N-acetyltransferase [Shewanella fidelis]MDW4819119.1 GNAT family N-acetyltransferase [Shewanella fidelis]MDW4823203.1 GNAT family N-acetyltransferase [Shewanella fidelis]